MENTGAVPVQRRFERLKYEPVSRFRLDPAERFSVPYLRRQIK
jgi:hypothetical protein